MDFDAVDFDTVDFDTMDMAALMLAAAAVAVVAEGFIRPKRAGLWPAIGPRWRERGTIAVIQTVDARPGEKPREKAARKPHESCAT
jgi:hypothetical protein